MPRRLPLILLILLTILPLARLVSADFTWWDDGHTLHHNPLMNPPGAHTLRHYWTHPHMGLYVPVTYTTWAALASLAHVETPDDNGITLNPAIFHAANLLLHTANVLLVYALLRKLTFPDLPALLAAALFAIHPVQVEPVAWISGLKDLLYTTFTLTALLTYLHAVQSPPSRGRLAHVLFFLSLLLTLLATLSKPTAVVTPLLIFTLSHFLLRHPWRTSLKHTLPFLLLVIPCAIWSKLIQSVPPLAPLWTRPLIATDAIAFYLSKLVVPLHLAPDYGRSPADVLARHTVYWTWLLPAMVALGLILSRKRHPTLIAASFLFLAPLLPLLGLTPFMFQRYSTTADHYLYLPMLGIALAAAYVLSLVPARRIAVAATCVLVFLATRSFLQAGVWHDDETLARHTLVVNPRSLPMLINLAQTLDARAERTGDPAGHRAAEDYFRRALVDHPASLVARQGLAVSLLHQHRDPEAIALLAESIRDYGHLAQTTDPEALANTYHTLALAYAQNDRRAEALSLLRKAATLNPADPTIPQSLRRLSTGP